MKNNVPDIGDARVASTFQIKYIATTIKNGRHHRGVIENFRKAVDRDFGEEK